MAWVGRCPTLPGCGPWPRLPPELWPDLRPRPKSGGRALLAVSPWVGCTCPAASAYLAMSSSRPTGSLPLLWVCESGARNLFQPALTPPSLPWATDLPLHTQGRPSSYSGGDLGCIKYALWGVSWRGLGLRMEACVGRTLPSNPQGPGRGHPSRGDSPLSPLRTPYVGGVLQVASGRDPSSLCWIPRPPSWGS